MKGEPLARETAFQNGRDDSLGIPPITLLQLLGLFDTIVAVLYQLGTTTDGAGGATRGCCLQVLTAELPRAPVSVTVTPHWLAVEGVQPAIPENPTPAEMAAREAAAKRPLPSHGKHPHARDKPTPGAPGAGTAVGGLGSVQVRESPAATPVGRPCPPPSPSTHPLARPLRQQVERSREPAGETLRVLGTRRAFVGLVERRASARTALYDAL